MNACKFSLTIAAVLLLFSSCEKLNLDDYLSPATDDGSFTVTFNVDSYLITDFDGNESYIGTDTRSVVPASELGSRLNLAVYQDGTRVKYVNQESTSGDFGTISVSLTEGTYDFVILVHSCDGNATTTNEEKITFPSNKVTDTFLYYKGDISVTADASYNISVSRCVAMYRLTIEDEIPDNITQMKFYYTGGSSTLDAVTGFGCVNSRETEYRDITSHESGQTFELYTFPHDQTGELKMVVSALDSDGNTCYEAEYDDIPVEMNKITNHTVTFFDGNGGATKSGEAQLTVEGENAWDGEINY